MRDHRFSAFPAPALTPELPRIMAALRSGRRLEAWTGGSGARSVFLDRRAWRWWPPSTTWRAERNVRGACLEEALNRLELDLSPSGAEPLPEPPNCTGRTSSNIDGWVRQNKLHVSADRRGLVTCRLTAQYLEPSPPDELVERARREGPQEWQVRGRHIMITALPRGYETKPLTTERSTLPSWTYTGIKIGFGLTVWEAFQTALAAELMEL